MVEVAGQHLWKPALFSRAAQFFQAEVQRVLSCLGDGQKSFIMNTKILLYEYSGPCKGFLHIHTFNSYGIFASLTSSDVPANYSARDGGRGDFRPYTMGAFRAQRSISLD